MDNRDEAEKIEDDAVLPGFRFHPTDEELVTFYLMKKIQHKSLPLELIHQVDIYKYDPWDLPKLASMGEKEWYFYCPRDRKYRNSARPNRVTGAGFWKATGTDRPIYASDGNKCIGLKKSLVFYRGRAAKGIKTDWMMHEFRLPSASDPAAAKKFPDKNIPPSDSWAICRIFKKTSNIAQRALSQSWAAQLHEMHTPDIFEQGRNSVQFSPENFSCVTPIHLYNTNDLQSSKSSSSSLETQSYKPVDESMMSDPPLSPRTANFMLWPPAASMLPNMSPFLNNHEFNQRSVKEFEASEDHFNDFTISFPHRNSVDVEGSIIKSVDCSQMRSIRGMESPFSLSPTNLLEPWKQPILPWDCTPSTSDMPITYSSEK